MISTSTLGDICSQIGSIPSTIISGIWFWISFAFLNYWHIIVPSLALWFIYEILTRNRHSFNSDNGFTPTLNSFVGGGVFFLSESLINLVLNFAFGKNIECSLLFVKSFYIIPFLTTGLFLHWTGFWIYWRLPIIDTKINLFNRKPSPFAGKRKNV